MELNEILNHLTRKKSIKNDVKSKQELNKCVFVSDTIVLFQLVQRKLTFWLLFHLGKFFDVNQKPYCFRMFSTIY